MKFHGNLLIARPVEKVWEFLWDIEKLSRCIPGCQGVKTIKDREKYELSIKDSVGPITVQFELLADVKWVNPPLHGRNDITWDRLRPPPPSPYQIGVICVRLESEWGMHRAPEGNRH